MSGVQFCTGSHTHVFRDVDEVEVLNTSSVLAFALWWRRVKLDEGGLGVLLLCYSLPLCIVSLVMTHQNKEICCALLLSLIYMFVKLSLC